MENLEPPQCPTTYSSSRAPSTGPPLTVMESSGANISAGNSHRSSFTNTKHQPTLAVSLNSTSPRSTLVRQVLSVHTGDVHGSGFEGSHVGDSPPVAKPLFQASLHQSRPSLSAPLHASPSGLGLGLGGGIASTTWSHSGAGGDVGGNPLRQSSGFLRQTSSFISGESQSLAGGAASSSTPRQHLQEMESHHHDQLLTIRHLLKTSDGAYSGRQSALHPFAPFQPATPAPHSTRYAFIPASGPAAAPRRAAQAAAPLSSSFMTTPALLPEAVLQEHVEEMSRLSKLALEPNPWMGRANQLKEEQSQRQRAWKTVESRVQRLQDQLEADGSSDLRSLNTADLERVAQESRAAIALLHETVEELRSEVRRTNKSKRDRQRREQDALRRQQMQQERILLQRQQQAEAVALTAQMRAASEVGEENRRKQLEVEHEQNAVHLQQLEEAMVALRGDLEEAEAKNQELEVEGQQQLAMAATHWDSEISNYRTQISSLAEDLTSAKEELQRALLEGRRRREAAETQYQQEVSQMEGVIDVLKLQIDNPVTISPKIVSSRNAPSSQGRGRPKKHRDRPHKGHSRHSKSSSKRRHRHRNSSRHSSEKRSHSRSSSSSSSSSGRGGRKPLTIGLPPPLQRGVSPPPPFVPLSDHPALGAPPPLVQPVWYPTPAPVSTLPSAPIRAVPPIGMPSGALPIPWLPLASASTSAALPVDSSRISSGHQLLPAPRHASLADDGQHAARNSTSFKAISEVRQAVDALRKQVDEAEKQHISSEPQIVAFDPHDPLSSSSVQPALSSAAQRSLHSAVGFETSTIVRQLQNLIPALESMAVQPETSDEDVPVVPPPIRTPRRVSSVRCASGGGSSSGFGPPEGDASELPLLLEELASLRNAIRTYQERNEDSYLSVQAAIATAATRRQREIDAIRVASSYGGSSVAGDSEPIMDEEDDEWEDDDDLEEEGQETRRSSARRGRGRRGRAGGAVHPAAREGGEDYDHSAAAEDGGVMWMIQESLDDLVYQPAPRFLPPASTTMTNPASEAVMCPPGTLSPAPGMAPVVYPEGGLTSQGSQHHSRPISSQRSTSYLPPGSSAGGGVRPRDVSSSSDEPPHKGGGSTRYRHRHAKHHKEEVDAEIQRKRVEENRQHELELERLHNTIDELSEHRILEQQEAEEQRKTGELRYRRELKQLEKQMKATEKAHRKQLEDAQASAAAAAFAVEQAALAQPSRVCPTPTPGPESSSSSSSDGKMRLQTTIDALAERMDEVSARLDTREERSPPNAPLLEKQLSVHLDALHETVDRRMSHLESLMERQQSHAGSRLHPPLLLPPGSDRHSATAVGDGSSAVTAARPSILVPPDSPMDNTAASTSRKPSEKAALSGESSPARPVVRIGDESGRNAISESTQPLELPTAASPERRTPSSPSYSAERERELIALQQQWMDRVNLDAEKQQQLQDLLRSMDSEMKILRLQHQESMDIVERERRKGQYDAEDAAAEATEETTRQLRLQMRQQQDETDKRLDGMRKLFIEMMQTTPQTTSSVLARPLAEEIVALEGIKAEVQSLREDMKKDTLKKEPLRSETTAADNIAAAAAASPGAELPTELDNRLKSLEDQIRQLLEMQPSDGYFPQKSVVVQAPGESLLRRTPSMGTLPASDKEPELVKPLQEEIQRLQGQQSVLEQHQLEREHLQRQWEENQEANLEALKKAMEALREKEDEAEPPEHAASPQQVASASRTDPQLERHLQTLGRALEDQLRYQKEENDLMNRRDDVRERHHREEMESVRQQIMGLNRSVEQVMRYQQERPHPNVSSLQQPVVFQLPPPVSHQAEGPYSAALRSELNVLSGTTRQQQEILQQTQDAVMGFRRTLSQLQRNVAEVLAAPPPILSPNPNAVPDDSLRRTLDDLHKQLERQLDEGSPQQARAHRELVKEVQQSHTAIQYLEDRLAALQQELQRSLVLQRELTDATTGGQPRPLVPRGSVEAALTPAQSPAPSASSFKDSKKPVSYFPVGPSPSLHTDRSLLPVMEVSDACYSPQVDQVPSESLFGGSMGSSGVLSSLQAQGPHKSDAGESLPLPELRRKRSVNVVRQSSQSVFGEGSPLNMSRQDSTMAKSADQREVRGPEQPQSRHTGSSERPSEPQTVLMPQQGSNVILEDVPTMRPATPQQEVQLDRQVTYSMPDVNVPSSVLSWHRGAFLQRGSSVYPDGSRVKEPSQREVVTFEHLPSHSIQDTGSPSKTAPQSVILHPSTENSSTAPLPVLRQTSYLSEQPSHSTYEIQSATPSLSYFRQFQPGFTNEEFAQLRDSEPELRQLLQAADHSIQEVSRRMESLETALLRTSRGTASPTPTTSARPASKGPPTSRPASRPTARTPKAKPGTASAAQSPRGSTPGEGGISSAEKALMQQMKTSTQAIDGLQHRVKQLQETLQSSEEDRRRLAASQAERLRQAEGSITSLQGTVQHASEDLRKSIEQRQLAEMALVQQVQESKVAIDNFEARVRQLQQALENAAVARKDTPPSRRASGTTVQQGKGPSTQTSREDPVAKGLQKQLRVSEDAVRTMKLRVQELEDALGRYDVQQHNMQQQLTSQLRELESGFHKTEWDLDAARRYRQENELLEEEQAHQREALAELQQRVEELNDQLLRHDRRVPAFQRLESESMHGQGPASPSASCYTDVAQSTPPLSSFSRPRSERSHRSPPLPSVTSREQKDRKASSTISRRKASEKESSPSRTESHAQLAGWHRQSSHYMENAGSPLAQSTVLLQGSSPFCAEPEKEEGERGEGPSSRKASMQRIPRVYRQSSKHMSDGGFLSPQPSSALLQRGSSMFPDDKSEGGEKEPLSVHRGEKSDVRRQAPPTSSSSSSKSRTPGSTTLRKSLSGVRSSSLPSSNRDEELRELLEAAQESIKEVNKRMDGLEGTLHSCRTVMRSKTIKSKVDSGSSTSPGRDAERHLLQQMEYSTKSMNALQNKVNHLQEALNRYDQKHEHMELLQAGQLKKTGRELTALEKQLQRTQQDLNRANMLRDKAEMGLSKEMQESQRDISHLEARVRQLQKAVDRSEKERRQVRASRSDSVKRDSPNNEAVVSLQRDLRAADSAVTTLKNRVNDLERALSRSGRDVQATHQCQKHITSDVVELKTSLQQTQREVEKLLATESGRSRRRERHGSTGGGSSPEVKPLQCHVEQLHSQMKHQRHSSPPSAETTSSVGDPTDKHSSSSSSSTSSGPSTAKSRPPPLNELDNEKDFTEVHYQDTTSTRVPPSTTSTKKHKVVHLSPRSSTKRHSFPRQRSSSRTSSRKSSLKRRTKRKSRLSRSADEVDLPEHVQRHIEELQAALSETNAELEETVRQRDKAEEALAQQASNGSPILALQHHLEELQAKLGKESSERQLDYTREIRKDREVVADASTSEEVEPRGIPRFQHEKEQLPRRKYVGSSAFTLHSIDVDHPGRETYPEEENDVEDDPQGVGGGRRRSRRHTNHSERDGVNAPYQPFDLNYLQSARSRKKHSVPTFHEDVKSYRSTTLRRPKHGPDVPPSEVSSMYGISNRNLNEMLKNTTNAIAEVNRTVEALQATAKQRSSAAQEEGADPASPNALRAEMQRSEANVQLNHQLAKCKDAMQDVEKYVSLMGKAFDDAKASKDPGDTAVQETMKKAQEAAVRHIRSCDTVVDVLAARLRELHWATHVAEKERQKLQHYTRDRGSARKASTPAAVKTQTQLRSAERAVDNVKRCFRKLVKTIATSQALERSLVGRKEMGSSSRDTEKSMLERQKAGRFLMQQLQRASNTMEHLRSGLETVQKELDAATVRAHNKSPTSREVKRVLQLQELLTASQQAIDALQQQIDALEQSIISPASALTPSTRFSGLGSDEDSSEDEEYMGSSDGSPTGKFLRRKQRLAVTLRSLRNALHIAERQRDEQVREMEMDHVRSEQGCLKRRAALESLLRYIEGAKQSRNKGGTQQQRDVAQHLEGLQARYNDGRELLEEHIREATKEEAVHRRRLERLQQRVKEIQTDLELLQRRYDTMNSRRTPNGSRKRRKKAEPAAEVFSVSVEPRSNSPRKNMDHVQHKVDSGRRAKPILDPFLKDHKRRDPSREVMENRLRALQEELEMRQSGRIQKQRILSPRQQARLETEEKQQIALLKKRFASLQQDMIHLYGVVPDVTNHSRMQKRHHSNESSDDGALEGTPHLYATTRPSSEPLRRHHHTTSATSTPPASTRRVPPQYRNVRSFYGGRTWKRRHSTTPHTSSSPYLRRVFPHEQGPYGGRGSRYPSRGEATPQRVPAPRQYRGDRSPPLEESPRRQLHPSASSVSPLRTRSHSDVRAAEMGYRVYTAVEGDDWLREKRKLERSHSPALTSGYGRSHSEETVQWNRGGGQHTDYRSGATPRLSREERPLLSPQRQPPRYSLNRRSRYAPPPGRRRHPTRRGSRSSPNSGSGQGRGVRRRSSLSPYLRRLADRSVRRGRPTRQFELGYIPSSSRRREHRNVPGPQSTYAQYFKTPSPSRSRGLTPARRREMHGNNCSELAQIEIENDQYSHLLNRHGFFGEGTYHLLRGTRQRRDI